jgi:hypothetical protein
MLLRRDIQTVTDRVFADKYLFDKNGKILFPIDISNFLGDTSRWLRITHVKQ